MSNILSKVLTSIIRKQLKRDNDSKDDELIPPIEMMFDGATSKSEFKNVGEGFTRYFLIEHARLKPNEKVLDVGCGNGQKARVLTKHLTDCGSYEGFDIGSSWNRVGKNQGKIAKRRLEIRLR